MHFLIYTAVGYIANKQQDNGVTNMTDTELRVSNRRQGERRNHHELHGPERRVHQERRTQADRRNS